MDAPEKIVIVGGGAAGFAAADMLRRQAFGGDIVMLSGEGSPPVDRPNLSKDYLAGSAPEDWLPLRPENFYDEAAIDLRLKTEVVSIDAGNRNVILADGGAVSYDRLLLATGAEPVKLSIPGADQPNVHCLRSLADCRAIIAADQRRATRDCDRREFHRLGGSGGVADARCRGPRGRAGAAPDGACAWA